MRMSNTFFVPGNQARLAGERVRQLIHGPGEGGSILLRRLRLRRDLRGSPETALQSWPMLRSAGPQVANHFPGLALNLLIAGLCCLTFTAS